MEYICCIFLLLLVFVLCLYWYWFDNTSHSRNFLLSTPASHAFSPLRPCSVTEFQVQSQSGQARTTGRMLSIVCTRLGVAAAAVVVAADTVLMMAGLSLWFYLGHGHINSRWPLEQVLGRTQFLLISYFLMRQQADEKESLRRPPCR